MRKIISLAIGIAAAVCSVYAETGIGPELVPEFSTPTLGIAIVLGGLGFALLRKK